MPGGMEVSGTEELAAMINKLGASAGKVAACALYDGADVMADAYEKAVRQIITHPRGNKESRETARYPTPEEKAAVKTGVSKFRRDGSEVNTIVGAAEGYAIVDGKRKAIKQIANAINSGTSFMHKQPVFRKASNRARKAAQETMVRTADQMINDIIK